MNGKILDTNPRPRANRIYQFYVGHSKSMPVRCSMIYQWWRVYTDFHQIYHSYLSNKIFVLTNNPLVEITTCEISKYLLNIAITTLSFKISMEPRDMKYKEVSTSP